jgi:phosphate transport system substrate-binding protein
MVLFSCDGQKESNQESDVKEKITIKGSDTEYLMVKELASAYMALHPNLEIEVQGGGSNQGILELIEHEADICNSSRELSEAERLGFENKKEKVIPIMFSVDALAIITNYKVGVDSLSVEQIAKVFSGEIKNWKELGGENVPVILFGRDTTSGTRNYFSKKMLSGLSKGKITECISNAAILDSVINTRGAVGYVGAGFLFDSAGKPNGKIWAMPVYIKGSQAVSPYQIAAVKKGDYVLTRPLYQYINGGASEAVKDFIYFELTKVGQDIVTKHGFFPINDYQTQINRLKGLIE